jgi:glycosyltransferase involved in cell wall biosynthesis
MKAVTLSVVVCNYNHAHYLPEALNAILNQSCRPLEVIVIDDASTDNSVDVIEQFVRRDPIVRLYRNEHNLGMWLSGNRALSLAVGDFIYFAAADDRVYPDLFEKSIKLLTQYPQAGVCSALVQLIGEQGDDKGWIKSPVIAKSSCYLTPKEVLSTLIRDGFWMTGQTTILRRDVLLRDTDGFMPELGHFSDLFLDMDMALRYGACFIPEVLATWRVLETGYAQTMWRDVALSREKFARVTELMRSSKYATIFPEAFTKVWEWRGWYGLEMRYYRHLLKDQVDFLERLRELRVKPTLLDTSFFAMLKFFVLAGGFLTKVYLWHRRINWDLPWLLVMLRSRFYKYGRQSDSQK